MHIIGHILTNSDCYRAGRTIVPTGIMVHSTGVAQPDVNVFLRAWNKPGVDACVHAFVHQGGVTETLPWNWRGWHAGGAANNTHISFEILEPAGHTYQGGTMIGYDPVKNAPYFSQVYDTAVELCAYLCTKYGLDPRRDIIDHAEGHKLGLASGHADVGHWFPRHGKSIDTLRADVEARLKGGEADMTEEQVNALLDRRLKELAARPVSDWAKAAWEKAGQSGVLDGTAPGSPLTREQAALMLERLGLLKQ